MVETLNYSNDLKVDYYEIVIGQPNKIVLQVLRESVKNDPVTLK